jgi:hypothetical protein
MKKLNFLLVLLCVCGVSLATTPIEKEKEKEPKEIIESSNSADFANPRTGHIRSEHELSGTLLGIITYKIKFVKCDKTPNVICVYRQGVPTSTELRRGDHSLIYSGSFSHEEEQESEDGIEYAFYFYVE